MSTLTQAKNRFAQAQELALKEGNEFNELIAIGLQELTQVDRVTLAVIDRFKQFRLRREFLELEPAP